MMDDRFLIAVTASLLAGVTTTLGTLSIRWFEAWATKNITCFMNVAAGVLTSAALVHMTPKSIAMAQQAPYLLLAGYFLMYGMDRIIKAHWCDIGGNPDATLGLIPLIGIGFHAFIDGFVYSISFTVSPGTGALVAVGMLLHEFPEGIVTYMLLLRGGFEKLGSV